MYCASVSADTEAPVVAKAATGTKRAATDDASSDEKRRRESSPPVEDTTDLVSERKTVKCSTPLAKTVKEMKLPGAAAAASTSSQSSSVEGVSKASEASSPQRTTRASAQRSSESEAEYGRITIEKGRIVGEITLGKN